MKYICRENGNVISLLDYQPNVPSSVTVLEIADDDAAKLDQGTHIFDVSSQSIIAKSDAIIAQENTAEQNGQEREFLNATDWKVLRHIRQKALGITTTLTEEQYLALEREREDAAQRIVDIE
jgi:hypothetical protein